MYAHYVARARYGLLPLLDDECARWLWTQLEAALPDALSVVLMPDHPHIVAPARKGTKRMLAAMLGAFSRTFGLGEVWERVPEGEVLVSPDKVQRSVRYTILNPCRPWSYRGSPMKLARDPLAWRWSTLRDVVGAVAHPWVDVDHLRGGLSWTSDDFVRRFHHYVSADPSVNVAGTRFPEPAEPCAMAQEPLARIANAALEATRAPRDGLRRPGMARSAFIGLAARQGWHNPALLAEICGTHRTTVWRHIRECPPALIAAAALCLGDERLSTRLDDAKRCIGRETLLVPPDLQRIASLR